MKKTLILLFIFVLAFSIRLSFIANANYEIEADEVDYNDLALGLIESKSYINPDDGSLTSNRPPLYSALLALIYIVFGHSYFIVRVIQALMSSFTVCFLYLISEKIFNNLTALFTGIFSSFYMIYIFYTKFLYIETFFTFMLVFITYLVVITNKPDILRFCILGLLCGFLTLIRATGFFIPLVAGIVLLIKMKEEKPFLRKLMPPCLALLACFVFVLVPWTIRNCKVHSRFVLISTNGGVNMYQAVRPVDGKLLELSPRDEVAKKAFGISNEAQRSSFFMREAVKAYKEDPIRAIKMFILRFLFFWHFIDWNVTDGNVINYHYIFIFPFAILGTIFSLKNKKEVFILLFIILYFTSFVLLFQGFARLRMPIDGFIVILGCYGIYEFINRQRKKIFPLLCIGAYFFFTFFLYKYSLQTKYFIRGLMQSLGLW